MVLTSTHNLCFEQKCEKYQNFLSENFQFLVVKFSIYLNRCVFVMNRPFSDVAAYMFNPLMRSRIFYLNALEWSISYIRGVLLVFIFIIIMFCRNFCVLWCLIWVHTVCLCHFYGAQSLNGLNNGTDKDYYL